MRLDKREQFLDTIPDDYHAIENVHRLENITEFILVALPGLIAVIGFIFG